jgi:large subunit ribosomal protein L30
MAARLRVRLHKSPISYNAKARGTVRALGLHRVGEVVEVPDNPATRGMARAIRFLVDVEELPDESGATVRSRARGARDTGPERAPATAGAREEGTSE